MISYSNLVVTCKEELVDGSSRKIEGNDLEGLGFKTNNGQIQKIRIFKNPEQ